MACSWQKKAGMVWNNGNLGYSDVQDPHQGIEANCSFIAALTSVVWVRPDKLILNGGDPVTISYYSTAGGSSSSVTVNWYLCWDGSMPCNAHSSTTAEIWPAIYEKAYGSWKKGSSIASCQDYANVSWGKSPCTALIHLIGKASTTKLNAGKTAAAILGDIKLRCSLNTGKTSIPIVAWTYTTAPSGVTYDAQISANHAYSMLGLYPDCYGQEIVLRNPTGVSIPTKPANTYWNGINLGEGKGIFTVSGVDFQKKFEGYGFVFP